MFQKNNDRVKMANVDMKSETTVKPIRAIVDAWAETELG